MDRKAPNAPQKKTLDIENSRGLERVIQSLCSKHALLEGKINLNFAKIRGKYFVLNKNFLFQQISKFGKLGMDQKSWLKVKEIYFVLKHQQSPDSTKLFITIFKKQTKRFGRLGPWDYFFVLQKYLLHNFSWVLDPWLHGQFSKKDSYWPDVLRPCSIHPCVHPSIISFIPSSHNTFIENNLYGFVVL